MKKQNKTGVFRADQRYLWLDYENDGNRLAIIRAILPELNITSIVHKEVQHDIIPVASTRGVRFDAVVQDDQNVIMILKCRWKIPAT